jgi:hypothetical protein
MLFFLAICDGIEDAGELRVEGCTLSNLAAVQVPGRAAARLGDIFLTRVFHADLHLSGPGTIALPKHQVIAIRVMQDQDMSGYHSIVRLDR